ncbi:She3p [Lachancea thermotolerans CBS 6340]|uniref:SWI5-dependent HO expression protein 3 n=1 Tax=Lachancea thermotolerans (strain ATCC 56472 / CBS 6340 / NRRL Y-8284) TaxID=559295 RepID=SHE3_LACTC|nr:KLTH0F11396p [Lachancea thermotolerans CBS 6340]C5DLA5.1 RecName: Full=SWI5-dependent HO expression protein 3 [Lachancea thermotolerans CBS 6340]CAR24256.1 KLTH0F11396p [Lachancea thermotolerans CBS 6340]
MSNQEVDFQAAHLESPMKMSPSKVSMNHGAFMANMQNGYSPTREGATAGSSSTRVIEALHAQIDSLTKTNLDLTVQSNNLLSRLESSNNTQSKHLESISTLKHENDNLGLMLSRKERRVRDLEQQLSQLKHSYEEAAMDNKTMRHQLQTSGQREGTLENQLQQLQVQYDALVDGQKRYREKYDLEVEELKKSLQDFKRDNEMYLTKNIQTVVSNNTALQTKINQYSGKYKNLESLSQQHMQELSREVEGMASKLDLAKWEKLYEESRNMAIEYSEKTNVPLSPSFLAQHGAKSGSRSPSTSSSSTFVHPSQIRVPKVRHSSSSAKRSSFYGSNVSVPGGTVPGVKQPSASPTTPSSGGLPGVRRSSSVRGSSSSSRNSSGDLASAESAAQSQKGASKNSANNKKKRMSSHSYSKSNGFSFGEP